MSNEQKVLEGKVKYEGKIFETNSGNLQILEYLNAKKVYVRFIETGFKVVATLSDIKKGEVKDRYFPSVHGVGIVGEESIKEGGKLPKEYKLWKNMLKRCYCEKYYTKQSTYKDCTVSDNFKYYSYFKEWCSSQIGFGNEGWCLDKDILIKGNKIYSEDTCVFVPREINNLLTKRDKLRGNYPIGVSPSKGKLQSYINKKGKKCGLGTFNTIEEAFLTYKKAKEAYIKEVANKWKDQIDPRVYEALMNYQVEITD